MFVAHAVVVKLETMLGVLKYYKENVNICIT
jgi:hypothetical protein